MSKFTDTVVWVMADEKIVKLQKASKTYELSDTVFEYLSKANLLEKLEDSEVDVEIDESVGENGTITRLALSGQASKKEDPVEREKSPESTSNNSGLIEKEVEISGVSVDKAGVKLKEDKDNKVWYTLDSTINAQKFKDECTKKAVLLTISPQEKGNDVIKGYVLKEESKKDTPVEKSKNSYNKSYNSDMQKSIEAQASMNSANRVVQAMVDKNSKADDVLKMITKIAIHNFRLIQDLKKEE